MNPNDTISVDPRRLIAAIIIGAAILVAIILGTGTVTFSSPSGVASVTVPPVPTTAATTAPAAGAVKGEVRVSVQHLSGTTYHFAYTVRDTGSTPIAGFQINGSRANLFHVKSPGWNAFGNGICNGKNAGLLVYWSTSSGAANQLNPGKSAQFSFDVNTTGPIKSTYALSYGTATATFGSTQGPAPSSLPTSGPCS